MGCNCGGNKQTVEQIKAAQAATPQANQNPSMNTQAQTQTPPRRQTGTQSFALEIAGGTRLLFGSKLEAESENVRRGYTGRVITI
jgi:hypothetical protein